MPISFPDQPPQGELEDGIMSSNFNALEVGSSLFELIEFSLNRTIGGESRVGVYGVNVAKVREVVRMPEINPLSSKVRGIAGIFELRGIPIPAISLAVALGDDRAEIHAEQQIIVTEFSMRRAGFIVDSTHRIRRLAWDKVMPPAADSETYINGMTLIEDNKFLFVLDLERILLGLEERSKGGMGGGSGVAFQTGGVPLPAAPAAPTAQAVASGPKILLVDDSQFILNSTKSALVKMGYNVNTAPDGQAALALLEAHNVNGAGPAFDLVVSDVEMPRMDGMTFTTKVREHPTLSTLPVILHTSLSGESSQQAGAKVGANGYVVKNDIRFLNEMIKEVLGRKAA